MKYYRLTTRAQMHGEVRESGYIFTLAEGETGPHKTVSANGPDVQIADHINGVGELKDVPLYVELSDDEERAIEEAEAAKIAEADAAAEAHPDRRAAQGDGGLRQDGPTIAEYVAAGYAPEGYPPTGYASRSTPEEVAEAIEVAKAGAAKAAQQDAGGDGVKPQSNASDGKPEDPEAKTEQPPAE